VLTRLCRLLILLKQVIFEIWDMSKFVGGDLESSECVVTWFFFLLLTIRSAEVRDSSILLYSYGQHFLVAANLCRRHFAIGERHHINAKINLKKNRL
jgi:hypothetical protein